jgi:FixJ family two-component response regulator
VSSEFGATTARLPCIAVVDDDPAVCNSLKFSLQLEGFVVRAYLNGVDLLDADDILTIDCFVIDQTMPRLTGLQLIERLRAHGVAKPAILLVSHTRASVGLQAEKLGVPVVEKPLLGDLLIERIRAACGPK